MEPLDRHFRQGALIGVGLLWIPVYLREVSQVYIPPCLEAMTVHDGFESLELTPADYSFPMFYTGCTISFRLRDPERGLITLRNAINSLVCQLPFLTGFVAASASKLGVMEVHPPLKEKPNPTSA